MTDDAIPGHSILDDLRRRPLCRDVGVTAAEPDDVDQLARVVAAAFHPLTSSAFLIPDEDARAKIYPEFFKLSYLEPGIATGVVHRSADSLACAVWLPVGDGVAADPPDGALELLTGQYHANFVAFERLLAEAHAPYRGTPHDLLGVVAAHPTVQRRGNLRALMAARLPTLDAAGRGSYLEAAEPYLVPIYERYGYRRTGTVIQLPNCQMFPMWRAPRSRR
jgi:predicted GNAT family N-acyltransferase